MNVEQVFVGRARTTALARFDTALDLPEESDALAEVKSACSM